MELRQLAHFVAVAEELHFTRAAARVHVVQSSLSASIHALEREMGAPLFVRDSRHVMLTQAGRALLPAARRALAAADEGRDAVAGIRGVLRGQLHVGAIQTLAVIDLPALLAGFAAPTPASPSGSATTPPRYSPARLPTPSWTSPSSMAPPTPPL